MRVLVASLLLAAVHAAGVSSAHAASRAPELGSQGTPAGEQVALAAPPAAAPPVRSPAPGAAASRDAAPSSEERPPVLGLTLDGGFPDGVALSALVRPVRPLRIDAGVTYNMIGFGVRGGATLVPFRSSVAPVLRGEFGHTFGGDATGFVGNFTTLTPAEQLLLRNVSYDYASLQLGLEFGASDRLVFFVRGGVAWFWTTVQNFQAAVQLASAGGAQTVSEAQDPKVRGVVPTATLGFLFYVW